MQQYKKITTKFILQSILLRNLSAIDIYDVSSMCGACINCPVARKVIEQSYILVCVVPIPSQEGDRAVIYTSMCGACTKPGR